MFSQKHDGNYRFYSAVSWEEDGTKQQLAAFEHKHNEYSIIKKIRKKGVEPEFALVAAKVSFDEADKEIIRYSREVFEENRKMNAEMRTLS